MGQLNEFCKLPDPVGTFERLFRAALQSLLPELAACPWHVREREVVNMFVFRHLIPQFQTSEEELDISQIAIEEPVLKLPKAKQDNSKEVVKVPRQTAGKNADIVVWSHANATRWVTCRPLVHIEWKNISSIEKKKARKLEQGHEDDICTLKHNRELVSVSYAVLTDQRDRHLEVRCTRIVDGNEPEDFFRPESFRSSQTGIVAEQRVLKNHQRVWCLKYTPKTAYSGKVLTYGELLRAIQGSACPNKVCKPGKQPISSAG